MVKGKKRERESATIKMMSLNKELECKVAHSVDDDDDTDEMDPFPLFLSLLSLSGSLSGSLLNSTLAGGICIKK